MIATGVIAAASLALPGFAVANTGGASIPGQEASDGPVGKAKLNKDGTATPPVDAPGPVVKAIEAANKIEDKPYKYGGGHGNIRDSGYDCSGAISFALIKAGVLDSPLDSSGFTRWGKRGKGDWITIYGHSGHAYAVIAGLRWDTSMTPGDGPGWSKEMRSASGFEKTHPKGL
jgi:hypothetical protein